MSRPLRIDLVDGWYHVTARGNARQPLFLDNRDREHFIELLAESVSQFNLRLHAWVLMDNHYHLVVQTPQANLSRAMHWLDVSYSVWFNHRHERVGHLFQGRFKAVVLDQSSAGEVCRYVHLNPVRFKKLGLDKSARQAQRAGISSVPDVQQVQERLQQLRQYRWSSYLSHAGLVPTPAWLTAEFVLGGFGGPGQVGRRRYREFVESAVREGLPISPWEKAQAGLVLGSQELLSQVRTALGGNRREQSGSRQLAKSTSVAEIIQVVENLKGEPWAHFRDRHRDWGRDLVLYLARKHGGLQLRELGEAAGGIDYVTVSVAVRRFRRRAEKDREVAGFIEAAERQLG